MGLTHSHWAEQALKKLNLWGKTAVDKSALIKAWLYSSSDTEWNRHFCHFGPFFHSLPSLIILKIKILKKNEKCLEILSFYAYMCTINEDHMIHGSWNIRWNRQKLLSFSAIFCPFSPLTTRKIKILKLKKTPADIIILQISTVNDNHMIYGSWDLDHDRHNFLSFWTVFCPFTPYESRQSKLWKDDKNTWRYYHFTNVYHKRQSYDVWFLRYRVQRF